MKMICCDHCKKKIFIREFGSLFQKHIFYFSYDNTGLERDEADDVYDPESDRIHIRR